MSGLPTPKSKTTKVIARGQAAGSREDVSSGRASGIVTPGSVSRENSFAKSQLPMLKRESSTPNLKRESSIPKIKREDSMPHIRTTSQKSAQKTPSRPSSAQPSLKKETPSMVKREGSLSQIKKGTSGVVRPRGAVTSSRSATPPREAQTTEILKVGDRVNITGSSKNGVIQYVGETRFAKGDWAGVVLDEAVGKNDGTVAGVRYFQCQSNYGVFVKVEKLLKLADVCDPHYKPHDSLTPMTDTNNKVKLPTTPKVTQVRAAESTEIPDNLRVGDKVSIGDARIGLLRYLGETGFAKGIWCGVELQEPLGKNDGAVAGTRYFQCEAKYGLFAPVHKVRKLEDGLPSTNSVVPNSEVKDEDPSQEKSEIAHVVNADKYKSLPDTELEIQDSSMPSSVSSIQIKLQDRENEIKKLLKDRELDKEENQKLLEQYQQSENKFTTLRITQDKLQRDHEEEIKRLQSMLSNLEKVKVSWETQLDEERRKLEDLQFQLEEQIVSKELSSEVDKENTRLLEEKISLKDAMIEKLEEEMQQLKHSEEDVKNRYSDLEFQLAETNEKEIQSSQSMTVLQEKLKCLEDVLNEAQGETDLQASYLSTELAKRDTDIEHLKKEVKAKEEASVDLDFQIKKYSDELNETIEAKGALNKEIFDLTSQLKTKDSENSEIFSRLEDLKNENIDMKIKVKNAETKIENLLAEKLKLEEEVSHLTKSSGDSSSQMTYVNEQLKETKREYTVLQDEKSSLAIKVETLLQNIEEFKENSSKEKANLTKKNEEQSNQLQETITALKDTITKQTQKQAELEENVRKYTEKQQVSDEKHRNFEQQLLEKDELLNEKNTEILDLSKRNNQVTTLLSELQNQIQQLKKECEEKSDELQNYLKSKLDEDQHSAILQSSHESLNREFEELKIKHESMEDEFKAISKKKDILSREIIETKKNSEKKDETINELEVEKIKIEDQKKSVDLEYIELSGNNKELKNQLLFAQDENSILKENINQMKTELIRGSDVTGKLQHELSIMKEEVTASKETIRKLENFKNKLEARCECLNEEKVKAFMESNNLLSLKASLEEETISLKNELQESLQREVNTRTSLEDDRIKLQDSVESSLSQLQQKEGELSSWRVKAQNLEKKVVEHELCIQKLQSSPVNGTEKTLDGNVNDNDLLVNKLKEDLQNKANEVMFLNTVVVEVQNKFKAAEEKIRLLEDGQGLFAESEGLDDTISPARPGLKQRLFCDICDEFDLHETEDCPTQCSLEDLGTQYHASRGEERAYCTICEVFGHKTEDCDDEETF